MVAINEDCALWTAPSALKGAAAVFASACCFNIHVVISGPGR